MLKVTGAVLAAGLTFAAQAFAADAPAEIKIGTLYASSGRYASISMPVHSALKLWIDQKNADGGVYVKAFDKKIPVKLVAYDDQSNTATASTLYNQLITQDKVDLLVADSGSVLTAPAVAIARDHKVFLFDQTGTGASFFSKDNPYIALMADPVSTIWPKPVADFVSHDGPGLGVIHFGYAPNDIAFLRNVQDVGVKFKMLFSIYAGLETELLEKNVGEKGLEHVFTYVPPSELEYPVNFGMTMKDYKAAWDKKYPDGKIEFGFNAVAGYTTGLVIEKTLSVATSLDQLELRRAVFSLSGELKTLDGTFALDETGGQIGELTPLGQLALDEHRVHDAIADDEPDAGSDALMLVYALVAGVLFGLYFSLVGIGLNLVFGVMRIVNLAHGDFLMLGAFVAFGVVTLAGIDPLFAVPLAFVIFIVIGLLLYWVLVPRLQGSVNPEMLSIILFFGLSQVIEAVTTIFFGTSERSIQSRALGTVFSTIRIKLFGGKPDAAGPIQIFGQGFPAAWVIAAITSLIAITLVYVYLYRTRLGTLTRAVMSRRDEAFATGIDVDRVSAAA